MTEMIKLKAPEGFTDVSFGGQSYEVDENGIVEVPVESAQFLYQFGFGNVAEEAEKAKAEAERKAAEEAEKAKAEAERKAAEEAEKAKAEAERKAAEEAEKAKRGRKAEAEKTE